MPDFLYERYLRLIKCSSKKIKYLLETKKTRISNFEMFRLLSATGFKVLKEVTGLFDHRIHFDLNYQNLKILSLGFLV